MDSINKSRKISNRKSRAKNKVSKRKVSKRKVSKPVSVEEPVPQYSPIKTNVRLSKNIKQCVSRSKVPLTDIQVKVIQYMYTHKSLLVVHGVGCGKTLTSIGVSQCYLDENPDNKVIFVGPAGLLGNFNKELNKYGVKNKDKYELYSFDKFLTETNNNNIRCNKNTLLIIDEAHNLRNIKSKKMLAVLDCAIKCDKKLLLTATPFVNSLRDFIPLINILYGDYVVGNQKEFNAGVVRQYITDDMTEENLRKIINLLYHKIDFQSGDRSLFPEKKIKHVAIPMTNEYYNKLKDLIAGEIVEDIQFDNPQKFYNGLRRAVNKTGNEYFSAKAVKIPKLIKDQKSIIYSNWIEFGTKIIEKVLKHKGISYEVITGKTKKEARIDILRRFNNESGDEDTFQVLILTKAGGEGLDLKEVRNVIILDPVWNDAGLQQIIGRAVRYKSHSKLPESERNVIVYMLILTEPGVTKWEMTKDVPSESGDRILYDIIRRKYYISKEFEKTLKYMSI